MTQFQQPQPREQSAPDRKTKSSKHLRRGQRSPQPPADNDTNTISLDTITQRLPSSLFLSMPPPIRLLVCSIGNPGSYLNTLHSAGHTVLTSLASSLSYPGFTKSRAHGNGLVSAGAEFTLWQSPTLMNVSGAGVAAAWRQFQRDTRGGGGGEEARLVVVHDELEIRLGEVRVKKGEASAKGHNGLKSVKQHLAGTEWWRVGVGIGRPESRDPDVVAGYVLRKMSAAERGKIEGAVGRVGMELRRLAGV